MFVQMTNALHDCRYVFTDTSTVPFKLMPSFQVLFHVPYTLFMFLA